MRRAGNQSPPPSSRSKASSVVGQNFSGLIQLEAIKKELTKHIQEELSKTLKNTLSSIMSQDINSIILSETSSVVQNPSKSVTKSKVFRDQERLSGVRNVALSKPKVDIDLFRKNLRSQTKFIPKVSKSQTKIVKPYSTVQQLETKPLNFNERNPPKRSLQEIIQANKSQKEANIPVSLNILPEISSTILEETKENKSNEKLISDFLNAFNQLKAGMNNESFSEDFKQLLMKLNMKDSNRDLNDFTIESFEDFLSLKPVEKSPDYEHNFGEISFSKDTNMIQSNRDLPTTMFNSEKKCLESQNRSFSSNSDEVLTDMEKAYKLNRMIIRRDTGKEALERRESLIKNLGLASTFEKKRQPFGEECEETKEPSLFI